MNVKLEAPFAHNEKWHGGSAEEMRIQEYGTEAVVVLVRNDGASSVVVGAVLNEGELRAFARAFDVEADRIERRKNVESREASHAR